MGKYRRCGMIILYEELKTDKSINLKHNQTEENMNCLSPSILSADYSILGEQLKQLDEAGHSMCI